MHRNIASLLLAAGLIVIAAPAGAAETRSVLVHTDDISLASEAGRAALRQRVNNAVHEVCQVTGWGFTLAAERAQEACSEKALAAAMPQVDALVQAAQTNRVAANRGVSVSRQ
ncbi:MAG TPA: UrcA family protein [Rhizomicrobium sp.]|nr:UrcA family protein [Rhizomicrobium sp.]